MMARLGVVAAALTWPGCGGGSQNASCMQLSAGSDLVARAAVLVLDVYGPPVDCAAAAGAAGDAAAPLTRRFLPTEAITLAVPPGPHTFVLRAYADSAATVEMGSGCAEASLAPGAQACISLDVAPIAASDGGSGDSDGGMCNLTCGDGQACVPSCCAIAITGDGSYSGDTRTSTDQRDTSQCGSQSGMAPDITYALTAVRDSTITVDTCAAVDFDTVVAVRTSCDGGFIRCSDDANNCGRFGSRVTFSAQAGQTYYVVVDGYGKQDEGTYTLTVSGM
jgi:hypothetical protein